MKRYIILLEILTLLVLVGCKKEEDNQSNESFSIEGVWEDENDELVFMSLDNSGNFALCAGKNAMFAGQYSKNDDNEIYATDRLNSNTIEIWYEKESNKQITVTVSFCSPTSTSYDCRGWYTMKKVNKPYPKSMEGSEWFIGDGLTYATYYRCIGQYDSYEIHRHNGQNEYINHKYIYREPLLYDQAEITSSSFPSIIVREMINYDNNITKGFKQTSLSFGY